MKYKNNIDLCIVDCGVVDILIMMDEIGIVGLYNFNIMKMFVKEFIWGFNFLFLRFSVLIFSSFVIKIFGFCNFFSLFVIMLEIDWVWYFFGGFIEIDKVLRYVRMFMFNIIRIDVFKVVILIMDGVLIN